jgi:glycosyltransferase involved in cell wall biosynthesis
MPQWPMRVAMLYGPAGPRRPWDWCRAAATAADVVEIVAVPALTLPPLPVLPHAGRDPDQPHLYQVAVLTGGGPVADRITAVRVEGVLRFEAAECGRIDVLHAHSPGARPDLPWLSRTTRIPYVLSEDDPGCLAQRRTARLYRHAAAVMTVSGSLLARVGELGLPGRHRLVPHPVDPAALPPVPARARIHQDPVRVAITEDWDVLAPAFAVAHAKDPRLRLQIIRDSSELPSVQSRIRQLGIAAATVLTPARSRPETIHELAHADLFAAPGARGNFCIPALDALSCGTQVVGTRTGALPDLVGHDAGILVPPADPHAFALALVEAAAGLPRHSRAALAERTRRRYGPSAVGARLAAVYAEASGRV